jgi:hypothetical protein
METIYSTRVIDLFEELGDKGMFGMAMSYGSPDDLEEVIRDVACEGDCVEDLVLNFEQRAQEYLDNVPMYARLPMNIKHVPTRIMNRVHSKKKQQKRKHSDAFTQEIEDGLIAARKELIELQNHILKVDTLLEAHIKASASHLSQATSVSVVPINQWSPTDESDIDNQIASMVVCEEVTIVPTPKATEQQHDIQSPRSRVSSC